MNQPHFNDVFISRRSILLRILQRMVSNRSTAEDLLHETYLRVMRALGERPVEHLEPFLFQTARNLALDHLRARRIHARTIVEDVPLAEVQGVGAAGPTLEDAAHAQRLLVSLDRTLQRLSPRQQRIFTLSRLQGCSYQDIAGQLGVSPSTVQKELKLIMAICIGVAARYAE